MKGYILKMYPFLFTIPIDHFIQSNLHFMQEYEPGIVAAFEEDHKIDHALIRKLKGSLMALDHAVSSEAKKQLDASLSHSFVEFMTFNLQHMAKEETILNNLLWRYYS